MHIGALLLAVVMAVSAGCAGPADLLSQVMVREPPADYAQEADGFRYARSLLSPQEQALYDQIAAGVAEQAEVIEGLYPDSDMLRNAVQAIDRDYPEFFWFTGSGKIETTLLAKRPMKASYRPNYRMDRAARSELQAQINAWESACLAGLPAGATDYDKALYVYRYIIDHADYQTVEDNAITHIMVDGQGLCGCYAKTAQYLLNRMGVDCAYISGTAGGEAHAWNLIWPDGVPCWMDVTWGDPVFEGGDPNEEPAFEYFGITTADLLRNHTLDETVPVPECVSEDYNYFRRTGLYFETYDEAAVLEAMVRTLSAGEDRVCLRFSDAAWPQATHLLIDQGGIHQLLRAAAEQAGARSPGESLWYSKNEPFCVLTVKMAQ